MLLLPTGLQHCLHCGVWHDRNHDVEQQNVLTNYFVSYAARFKVMQRTGCLRACKRSLVVGCCLESLDPATLHTALGIALS